MSVPSGIPTTAKGKNKNHYGKKFGKKHADAMFEFTKTLWLQDATTSLRNLLQVEAAQVGFMKFLKVVYMLLVYLLACSVRIMFIAICINISYPIYS